MSYPVQTESLSGLICFEDSTNDSQEHQVGLPIMHWAATD